MIVSHIQQEVLTRVHRRDGCEALRWHQGAVYDVQVARADLQTAQAPCAAALPLSHWMALLLTGDGAYDCEMVLFALQQWAAHR